MESADVEVKLIIFHAFLSSLYRFIMNARNEHVNGLSTKGRSIPYCGN